MHNSYNNFTPRPPVTKEQAEFDRKRVIQIHKRFVERKTRENGTKPKLISEETFQ